MRHALISLSMIACVAVGCESGGKGSRSNAASPSKTQLLDKAAQMNADGERLRADAIAKQRQGDAADAKRETTAADKMITDAKMMKDQALLRDSKVAD